MINAVVAVEGRHFEPDTPAVIDSGDFLSPPSSKHLFT